MHTILYKESLVLLHFLKTLLVLLFLLTSRFITRCGVTRQEVTTLLCALLNLSFLFGKCNVGLPCLVLDALPCLFGSWVKVDLFLWMSISFHPQFSFLLQHTILLAELPSFLPYIIFWVSTPNSFTQHNIIFIFCASIILLGSLACLKNMLFVLSYHQL